MAVKKKVKKAAKVTGTVGATGYAVRLYVVGSRAKRVAQYKTARGDMRKVKRVAGKVGRTASNATRPIGNSRPAVGGAMYGERFAGHARNKAGSVASGFKSHASSVSNEYSRQHASGKQGYGWGRSGASSKLYGSVRSGPRVAGGAGYAAGRAVNHVGSHKAAYGAGAAVAGAGAATYAYKRRKAKKAAARAKGVRR